MTPGGHILAPDQLASAIRERPDQFELYRAASTFRSYRRDYESLRLPTLVIYGSNDQLIPVMLSKPIFESALADDRGHIHEFRVFDGADHDIQTPDGSVLPEYLAVMVSWARARFDDVR